MYNQNDRIIVVKMCLLLGLCALHLLVTAFFVAPGYLSIDEAIYDWMMKSFSSTWSIEIWNGYHEFPSPALAHFFTPIHGDKLVSQYPNLYPILAYPFYSFMGFVGLFWMNSLSFIGVVALCFFTARELFRDVDLSLNSCLILVLATFSWEYSQAAWPHMIATLFISATFCLIVLAHNSGTLRRSALFAFTAGLLAGFAPGLRYDSALIMPALFIPFLFERPTRLIPMIASTVGLVPGLLVNAGLNYLKFKEFSPFADGHHSPLPIKTIVLGLAFLFFTWAATRNRAGEIIKAHRKRIAIFLIIFALAVLVVPQTRSFISDRLHKSWFALIDMRAFQSDKPMPAMSRSQGGGVVYNGAEKKALLQSLPFLSLLIIPLMRIGLNAEDAPALAMLFILPVTTIAARASFTTVEGGLGINMRYFLSFLPQIAILCAYAIQHLRRSWGNPPKFYFLTFSACVTGLIYFFLVYEMRNNVDQLEFPLLVFPLILSVFTLFFIIAGEKLKVPEAYAIKNMGWIVLSVAFVWSGLVAFFYDYPFHRQLRQSNYEFGKLIAPKVSSNSLVFIEGPIDPFMRLVESDRVRLAFPGHDGFRNLGFKDFMPLLEFHTKAGRRVFASLPWGRWEQLKQGPLANCLISPLLQHPIFCFAEIQCLTGKTE
jgi:hypothetical protein